MERVTSTVGHEQDLRGAISAKPGGREFSNGPESAGLKKLKGGRAGNLVAPGGETVLGNENRIPTAATAAGLGKGVYTRG